MTNENALPGSHVGDGAAHPAPLRHLVSKRALWFGIVGAPAAWSAQFLRSYAFAAHSCFPRLAPFAEPELGAQELTTILLVSSVLGLAIAVCGLMLAVHNWRSTLHETGGDTHNALDIGEGRARFMALGGILISAVFVVAVCAQGVLVLSVKACTQ